MASRSLYAPVIDSYQPAFVVKAGSNNSCKIRFALSKFNGRQDFSCVQATVKKQSTGVSVVKQDGLRQTGIILDIPCQQDDNGLFIEIFDEDIKNLSSDENYPGWCPGTVYKIQIRLSESTFADTSNGLTQYQWTNEKANTFSEWSTVCNIKATGEMRIQVPSLQFDSAVEVNDENEEKELFVETLNFNGIFSSEIDPTEFLYTYQIDIYRTSDMKFLNSSGILYGTTDKIEQSLLYFPNVTFIPNTGYTFRLTYQTQNYYTDSIDFNVFYTFSSNNIPEIRVLSLDNDLYSDTIFDDSKHSTHAEKYAKGLIHSISSIEKEEEDGRVALCLYGEDVISANVIVKRASSKDNFITWEDIKIFNLITEKPGPGNFSDDYLTENEKDLPEAEKDRIIAERWQHKFNNSYFYDYTIESGVLYRYAVQTEDEFGNRSDINEALSESTSPVVRYFENAHLLGENNRQLNLKFDNTMNTYKITVSETKTDTIGSKYPIFTRNSNLKYKTFQVAGIISLAMDENQLFASPSTLYGDENGGFTSVINQYRLDEGVYGTSLRAHNYEKDFRNAVIDFLNDGKVKLYKSRQEGNILVRLMDIQITPNQQLGRLICNFTANAHEVAEANIENYIKYNLINLGECITDFSKQIYKLGQLSMSIETKGTYINKETGEEFTQIGTDIISEIYNKYDFKGQNIAGHVYSIINIRGLKIEIDHHPLQTPMGIKGFVMEYNGEQIYITSIDSIYEFDPNIIFDKSSSLYLLIDKENYLNQVDVTIDFVYYLKIAKYRGRQIKTKTDKRIFGQLHDYFKPGSSLYSAIYNKYYYEDDNQSSDIQFRRLYQLFGICIEANPGSVFRISQDQDVNNTTDFVVGPNGIVNFYNLTNFQNIIYLGKQNLNSNTIDDTIGTDVVLDYFCYTRFGKYQEEEE